MNGMWLVSYVALWILVILLTVIVLGLVRQLGLIHLRLGPERGVLTPTEGLENGSAAPDFHAVDAISKENFTLATLGDRPSLLIFVSPACRPCLELMPHIASFWRSQHKKLNIVLFSQSNDVSNFNLSNVSIPVLPDADGVIARAYRVRATPFAYRLDNSGIVKQRGIVNNSEDLEALLQDLSTTEAMVELPSPEVSAGNEEVGPSATRKELSHVTK